MTGRPSKFTQALAAEICGRISEGQSLRAICRDEKMPAASTVFLWLSQNEAFSEQYARARDAQADALFDEILEIADDARNDWMARNGEDAAGWAVNGEHIQRSRLRVDSRKWMAARLAPKKYGERVDLNHSGDVGVTTVFSATPLTADEWSQQHSPDTLQ